MKINCFNDLIGQLRERKLKTQKNCLVIAIDGRCGSGKTTLGNKIKETLNCPIVHMDHFFLPKDLRTESRYAEPGGNVHYERVKEEVIDHLGSEINYKIFNCHTMSYEGSVEIKEGYEYLIIEGSYSLNPYFGKYYDVAIFIEIDEEFQWERINKREGKRAEMFKRWMELENKYINTFKINEKCDIIIESKQMNDNI